MRILSANSPLSILHSTAKIGMPQKGLKKVMGFWKVENSFLKRFSAFPNTNPYQKTSGFFLHHFRYAVPVNSGAYCGSVRGRCPLLWKKPENNRIHWQNRQIPRSL